MITSIHQPHFFPWYGYINKIASSDIFVLLDECQFTKGSKMNRQTLLCNNGSLKYITLPVVKQGLLSTPYKNIIISDDSWRTNCKQFIMNNYKKYPYFNEIWNKIDYIFNLDCDHIFDIVNETILCILKMLDIKTKIVYQSNLDLRKELKNNELLIDILLKVECSHYISGNGARKYMDICKFKENHIKVSFQEFTYPSYDKYINHNETNISILDLLFNQGIRYTQEYVKNDAEKSRKIYLSEGNE